MLECAAIVLAAGLSRRMGDVNKLLIPMADGAPMIRQTVSSYLAICGGGVWVVTGHEHTRIEAALRDLDVHLVHNPDFAQGQKTSVAAGLAALDYTGDVFIGLGDQPFLTPDDLAWLLIRHRMWGGEKISIPVKQETRGNPIVVPDHIRHRLLADRRNPGCHNFTRSNPQLVQNLPTQRDAFCHDLDTPQDIAALHNPGHAAA